MAITVDPNLPRRETVQPVANPVSTYVRPADPAASPLHELAEGLSNFSTGLDTYFKRQKEITDEEDTIRARAAALKANGEGYAEGVRNGSIAPQNSPVFMRAYKKAQGEILGKRIAAKAATAYQTWEGRNSEDPNDFDNFLGTFVRDNLTIDDADVLKGAIPYLEQTSTTLYNQNENDRSTALLNRSVDASVASSAQDVDATYQLGIAAGGEVNYDDMWSSVLANRQDALDSGILADTYDKQMATLLANKAIEHKDPMILELMKRNLPGRTYSLQDTTEGATIYRSTINSMETMWSQDQTALAAAQKKADETAKDRNTADAIAIIAADPSYVFPEEWYQQAEILDPTIRDRVRGWKEEWSKQEPEDQDAILRIEQGILSGQYVQSDLQEDMGPNGFVKSSETVTRLNNLINSVSDNKLQPLFDNQTYKSSMTYLQKALTPQDMLGIDPTLVSTAGIAAQVDYQRAMIDWYSNNPKASYSDIIEQSAKTLKAVQEGIQPGDLGNIPEYMTPPALGLEPGTNALAEDQQVDENGNPIQPMPEGEQTEDPYAAWRTDVPPTMQGLNETQRDMIERESQNLGISPDEYIRELHKNLQGYMPNPDGTMPQEDAQLTKSSTNPAQRIEDPVFKDAGFKAHHAAIKGKANYFTGGKNKPPAGDPGTAAWQSKNTKIIKVKLSDGKDQNLRVYGPAATAFAGFIKDLQATGYTIDNVGGQVVRNKRGSNSRSEHSYGTAIDINGEGPDHNHDKMADSPARNGFSTKLVTDLPPNISELAAKWGLSWGGDWKGKKDAMHFEYTGAMPYKRTTV